MANELARSQARDVAIQQEGGEVVDAFLAMIERAARDPSIDINKMERLFEMRDRVQSQGAKVAFDQAFADMQPNLPAVEKRGDGNNGRYAKWEDIQGKVNPVLHEYGFGLMFKTDTSGDRVRVTAILRHRLGHSESTDFELKPDKSGNKQDVHAVASAVSYAKRYAASALLNIQTKGEDDDGNRAAGAKYITAEQAQEIEVLLSHIKADDKTRSAFLKWAKAESVETIPAKNYRGAVAELRRRRDQAGAK